MPEAFKIIKASLLMVENMYYYIIKVKENPHPFLDTFGMGGVDPLGAHCLLNGLGQALDMPG